VRLGLARFLRLRKPAEGARLVALAQRWRPYRSLAAWYMWRTLEDSRA
jgi:DNA-3-methyladenine glycosylase II